MATPWDPGNSQNSTDGCSVRYDNEMIASFPMLARSALVGCAKSHLFLLDRISDCWRKINRLPVVTRHSLAHCPPFSPIDNVTSIPTDKGIPQTFPQTFPQTTAFLLRRKIHGKTYFVISCVSHSKLVKVVGFRFVILNTSVTFSLKS